MGVAEKSAEVAASYVSMEAEIPEVLYLSLIHISEPTRPVAGVTENAADLLRLRWEIF